MSDEILSDGYFAVVPEWVLDADISAQAVRLYAVLRRYADQHSGQAFPSRRTLAARLRVASTRTVDAALDDLLRIGAVDISAQVRGDGGNGTSRYTIRGVQKPSEVQKVRTPVQQTAQGGAAGCAPPVQQIAQAPAQQTAPLEPEPLEPKPTNQTPAPTEQGGAGGQLRLVDEGPPQRRAKPRRRIPADWQPSPGVRANVDQRFPGWERRETVEEFRDYWLAAGRPMADWDLTWRNRVRELADRAGRNGYRSGPNRAYGPLMDIPSDPDAHRGAF